MEKLIIKASYAMERCIEEMYKNQPLLCINLDI